ncbi:MAG TPA: MtrAB system histidine kinase MtrB [Aeromicrobium sp.]|nr:MtrAB system histidine kinase MtrB [Aeromicrobium sp.]
MRRLARLWRRSIQTRVVASTIALSTLFIGATGWALIADVADSLASASRDAAVGEAGLAISAAQSQLDATVEAAPAAQVQVLNSLVDSVTDLDGGARAYELVLEGPLGAQDVPVRSSMALAAGSIPAALRRTVVSREGTYAAYSTISALGSDEHYPAVVIGRRLHAPRTGDAYALFYLFSMENQQATLRLVQQALLLGGAAAVVMVGGISFLVSRQVLSPVRMARRIAEQYSRGELQMRMAVHGEDDIARLSTSFNAMAASLQSQITRLEQLSVLQQRFVSDVSHELRTPLTTVQMAGSLLFEARDQFDPVTARSAELLKTELDRFEDLLVNLLDLSRFDTGAAHLELEPVDLTEVAREFAEDRLLDGFEVVVLGADEPAVVQADPRRVARILRNLVANASKYSQSDRLEIEVDQLADRVSLIVRDFGIGLSPADAAHVFDRFWRADPARTEGGTGLGLAIAREDALLHGGSLLVFSRVGEGTEFLLTLPRVPFAEGESGELRPALRPVFA